MTTTACQPDSIAAIAQRVVRLVNEVVAGARPGRQVTPLFTVHLRGMIRRARPQPGGVAQVRHLVIMSHSEGVYEIVAVCTHGGRVTALGLQVTRTADGRWQITDMAHPQFCDGPAPSCPTCRVTRHGGNGAHG